MDKILIDNINKKVRPKDVLYILGDLTLNSNIHKVEEIWKSIVCNNKYIVPGNHDQRWIKDNKRVYYNSPLAIDQLIEPLDSIVLIKDQGYLITLCHYPIESWFRRYDPYSIHLHGHTHGNSTKAPRRFDVGVDCWNYQPVALNQIIDSLEASAII